MFCDDHLSFTSKITGQESDKPAYGGSELGYLSSTYFEVTDDANLLTMMAGHNGV